MVLVSKIHHWILYRKAIYLHNQTSGYRTSEILFQVWIVWITRDLIAVLNVRFWEYDVFDNGIFLVFFKHERFMFFITGQNIRLWIEMYLYSETEIIQTFLFLSNLLLTCFCHFILFNVLFNVRPSDVRGFQVRDVMGALIRT